VDPRRKGKLKEGGEDRGGRQNKTVRDSHLPIWNISPLKKRKKSVGSRISSLRAKSHHLMVYEIDGRGTNDREEETS